MILWDEIKVGRLTSDAHLIHFRLIRGTATQTAVAKRRLSHEISCLRPYLCGPASLPDAEGCSLKKMYYK